MQVQTPELWGNAVLDQVALKLSEQGWRIDGWLEDATLFHRFVIPFFFVRPTAKMSQQNRTSAEEKKGHDDDTPGRDGGDGVGLDRSKSDKIPAGGCIKRMALGAPDEHRVRIGVRPFRHTGIAKLPVNVPGVAMLAAKGLTTELEAIGVRDAGLNIHEQNRKKVAAPYLKRTASGYLISLPGGLGPNGIVTVNDTQGGFNASGTIHIGRDVQNGQEIVTFDGSIRIMKKLLGPGGGLLLGVIKVVGCHATADDLDICICGANLGSVEIVQLNCSNQVGWSCISNVCPGGGGGGEE